MNMRSAFARPEGDSHDDGAADDLDMFLKEHGGRPYRSRAVRPGSQAVARVAVWAAVVVGAVGGAVGLASMSRSADPATVEAPEDDDDVPPGVAGMAELVAQQWLISTEDDRDQVSELFVESPLLPEPHETRGISVVDARAIAGERVSDGYWAVTVAVDLVENPPAAEEDDDTSSTGPEQSEPEEAEVDGAEVPGPLRWYVEVGVVGDSTKGLAALRTPAIMPAPPEVEDGWSSSETSSQAPDPDDPLTETVEAFLQAHLAGDGEPGPYLASGAEIELFNPPPFDDVALDALAVAEVDDERVRVQAYVSGTTSTGWVQHTAYEVVARWRDDRWQITELWGAASPASRPTSDGEDAG